MQSRKTQNKKVGRRGRGGNSSLPGDVMSGTLLNVAPRALPAQIRQAQRQYRCVRKVFAHSGTLATNAVGVIAQQAITGSNAVTACTNWSTAVANFLEYRVVGVELWMFPVVNAQTNLTNPAPLNLAMASYASGYASTTFDEVASASDSIIVDGRDPWKFCVTSKGNLDGMQWTATNTAIPSAESFGIVIASDLSAPAATASSTYFKWTAKYLVELRSMD